MTKEEILQRATIAAIPGAHRECAGKDNYAIAARAKEIGQAICDVLPLPADTGQTRGAKQALGRKARPK